MKKCSLGFLTSLLAGALLTGCATGLTPLQKADLKAKALLNPPPGQSGIYIYRASFAGKDQKFDIFVDNQCLGSLNENNYVYLTVVSGKEHEILGESRNKPDQLMLHPESGKNYFIKQSLKRGLFANSTSLDLVADGDGMRAITRPQMHMAKPGKCKDLPLL